MALLWLASLIEHHYEHAMSPVFKRAGMRESPCSFKGGCADYDPDHGEAHLKALDENDKAWSSGRSHLPIEHLDLTKTTIHGFEPEGDPATVEQYVNHPGSREGPPPVAFRHRSAVHLLDGHHAAAAGIIRKDKDFPVHMVDLDHQSISKDT